VLWIALFFHSSLSTDMLMIFLMFSQWMVGLDTGGLHVLSGLISFQRISIWHPIMHWLSCSSRYISYQTVKWFCVEGFRLVFPILFLLSHKVMGASGQGMWSQDDVVSMHVFNVDHKL
jgi:hypothetical protein